MAEGVDEGTDEAVGESPDPAVDAAEHLAAAIGTQAWPVACEKVAALLPGEGGAAAERVQAWAAEALRRDGEDLNTFLIESVPGWQEQIAAALAGDPTRAEQARHFTETIRSLLLPSDGAATQVATATGHGTVNAVQNGNIYYQVVLGNTPRPPRMRRGATAAVTTTAITGAAVTGTAAARHFASDAAEKAAAGQLPQGPLADPAQLPTAVAPQGVPAASTAGASAHGAAAAVKSGAGLLGKVAGVLGGGAAGVSVPVVIAVVSVVVVAVTTVSFVVTRSSDRASCGAAVGGRSAPAVLAEAARRTGLTSFRFTVARGRHQVAGAADPRTRTAWFTQTVGGGTTVAGTIKQGKVSLPAGAAAPQGADSRLVRADGAFTDAADPTAAAQLLASVTTAKRTGCAFSGTLAQAQNGTAPTDKASQAGPEPTGTSPTHASAPAEAGNPAVPFTARIDDRGRLLNLTAKSVAPGSYPVSARYWDFGLAVAPSAPPWTATPPSPESGSHPASAIDGEWAGQWSVSFASGTFTAKLNLNGSQIIGDLAVFGTGCALDGAVSGTLDGRRITFGTVDSAVRISFTGTVDGTVMNGTFSTDCNHAEGDWTARHSG
ncbi:hypothetical protein [Streptomyces sp. NPDC019890]|uniref:hypothetical protein n=1 Tax=Streptomyces sp. NPDC019890 TaxID=3365064 RepID=UPI00385025CB